MKRLLFIVSIFFTVVSIFPQTNIEILNQLKAFTENASNNNRINNGMWQNPKNANIWENLMVTQELIVSRNNLEIKGYNRQYSNGQWESITITFTSKDFGNITEGYISNNIGKNIYNEAIMVFGNPDRTLDYGFLQDNPRRKELVAQWDKGKYGIEFSIHDVMYLLDDPKIFYINIKVVNIENIQKVVQLVGLNIKYTSGQLYMEHNNTWQEWNGVNNSPMILDYNRNEVLTLGFKPNGKILTQNLNEATFAYYSNNNVMVFHFKLNRINGNVEILYYNDKNASLIGRFRGQAERINIFEPLF